MPINCYTADNVQSSSFSLDLNSSSLSLVQIQCFVSHHQTGPYWGERWQHATNGHTICRWHWMNSSAAWLQHLPDSLMFSWFSGGLYSIKQHKLLRWVDNSGLPSPVTQHWHLSSHIVIICICIPAVIVEDNACLFLIHTFTDKNRLNSSTVLIMRLPSGLTSINYRVSN